MASALSFPPATFAKVSPGPYLLAHLKPTSSSASPTRPSGRAPTESRSPTINTGSLTHANGSAVVRAGDTAVVCGVRAEILLTSDIPHPFRSNSNSNSNSSSSSSSSSSSNEGTDDGAREIEQLGLLVPNLELSTGCSPAHLPGNAPGTLAQSLTQRLLSLLHISKLVDGSDLRIQYQPPQTDDDLPDAPPPVVTKAYWALYIDVLCISLDGNAFDAAWAAVLAALKDTKLPRAWWDADREMVLCSEKAAEASVLSLRGLPVASTSAVFSTAGPRRRREEAESWVLADPDAFEEELCDEMVTVVTTAGTGGNNGGILRIEKNGGGCVGRDAMREVVAGAESRRSAWEKVFTQENK